jgi:hypothetical protein
LRPSIAVAVLFAVLAAERAFRVFALAGLAQGALGLWVTSLLQVVGAAAAAFGLLTLHRIALPGIVLFVAARVVHVGAEAFAYGIRSFWEAVGAALVALALGALGWVVYARDAGSRSPERS